MKKYVMYVANDIRIIGLIYVVSLALSSVLFSHFEGKNLLDSFYWSCVTSLTVGYGDISPVTLEGRITMMFFGHFWTFGTLPLIVSNIILKVIEDKDAFTNDEQEELKQSVRKILAHCEEVRKK
jgi:voltage-gated potassium channel